MPFLFRIVLGSVLDNPNFKKNVFAGLKKLVDNPNSDFDEQSIAVAEDIWDILVPILIGSK